MEFDGFDWDDGNWPKCGKHGVSKEEIEAVFARSDTAIFRDRSHSGDEDRYLAIAIGAEPREGILIGFTERIRGDFRLVRPLTARYMHAKEVRRYERDNDQ
jgi:uncharacterized protein